MAGPVWEQKSLALEFALKTTRKWFQDKVWSFIFLLQVFCCVRMRLSMTLCKFYIDSTARGRRLSSSGVGPISGGRLGMCIRTNTRSGPEMTWSGWFSGCGRFKQITNYLVLLPSRGEALLCLTWCILVTDRIQCTDGMLLKRLICTFVAHVLGSLSNHLLSGKQTAILWATWWNDLQGKELRYSANRW